MSLSEPTDRKVPERPFYELTTSVAADHTTMVPMADGVRLATDIYLPASARSKLPTLLTRTSYGRASSLSHASLPVIARFLTDRGYAVVVQDVRGKGHSEGERYPNVNEASDGYDVVEWIARQSFSNGKVGMFGPSYLGFTQWAAASSAPAALRCIAPRSIGVNVDYPMRTQGVPWLEDARWFVDTWDRAEYVRDEAWEWGYPLLESVPEWLSRGKQILSDYVCGQQDRSYHLGRIFPNGNPTETITIPALHVSAWWDGFVEGQTEDWSRARQAPAGAEQFLSIRAADHFVDYDPSLVPGTSPDADSDGGYWMDDKVLERELPSLMFAELDFFERFLRGGTAPDLRPVTYQVANSGWESDDTWPPSKASPMVLYLSGAHHAADSAEGGQLTEGFDGEISRVSWLHDPENPVLSLLEWEWAPLAAPPDETASHVRSDVMTFTSGPIGRSASIVGSPRARLVVGSSARSTHLVVTLSEVDEQGRARMIAEGASHAELSTSDKVTVGVKLASTGYRLRPESRLRLSIASSCYPRYAVHPGVGGNLWTVTEKREVEQTLFAGGPHGSSLEIPILQD